MYNKWFRVGPDALRRAHLIDTFSADAVPWRGWSIEMLSKLRDYSSYFLWFVVTTFVGFMAFSGVETCGSTAAQRGILAEVNGQPITVRTYSSAVSRATQNEQAQRGVDLTEAQIGAVREQTWQQLMGALLLTQESDRREIRISDAELANFLLQYPPADIQAAPLFQTDGQFDYAKYSAAMRDNSPQMTQIWKQIEAFWRPQLRQSKLQQQVISTVRVSEAELEEYYSKSNDAARIEFLLVDAVSYRPDVSAPTDEELKALYEEESPRYQVAERVIVDLALWFRAPSAGDLQYARDEIDRIKLELTDPDKDFAEVASFYTQDPSGSSSGGDLGWFGRGAMVKEFEDMAYALEVGEVSDPVSTQFGWHIIKVEEQREAQNADTGMELRARHILIKPRVSSATSDSIFQVSQDFAYMLREHTVEFTRDAVVDLGGKFSRPTSLKKQDRIPGIGAASDLKAWLFSASPGDVSDPIDDGGNFVVARLVEYREAGISALDEVESQLRARYIQMGARKLARVQADSLQKEALAGAVMRDLAAADNVTLTTTGLFTRNMNVANVGKSPLFMGSVFALTDEEPWSKPTQIENGWVMVHLLEMQRADLIEMEPVRDSLRGLILTNKQTNAFTVWLTNLIENAEVKDYRSDLYSN